MSNFEELWEDHENEQRDKHNSFLLYKSLRASVFDLTDLEAGQLFKAVFEFACDGATTDFSDRMMRSIFREMTNAITRDDERYFATCKRNARNAAARWARDKESANEHK